MKSKLIILLTLMFLLIPVYAWAVEVSLNPLLPLAKDPRALGMAGAMTALGDSPTSAIFNPALMGEYNSFSLKVGVGAYPTDETSWNNFNKFNEYMNRFNSNQEPPDDDFSFDGFLTGYANLGIGRLGLTVWGDAPVSLNYYKYKNPNFSDPNYTPSSPEEIIIEGDIGISATLNANGALTIALPVIDLGKTKLNVGANLRINVIGWTYNSIDAKLNVAGLTYSYYTHDHQVTTPDGTYTAYNYLDLNNEELSLRNWAIDLGAYLKLSENFALGISAQNVYAKWIGGEYKYDNSQRYWDSDMTLQTHDESSGEGSIPPEELDVPPLSLKAGAFLKVPVLSTRVAFDVDLDQNFQPTLYRLGVEQPLLFFVVRGGAILDTNFQPMYYTLGAGLNLLIVQVNAGLGFGASGSFIETIQNTQPLVASLSGSIQF